jgi:hypothetical protein
MTIAHNHYFYFARSGAEVGLCSRITPEQILAKM